jgi:hypothetical protein
MMEESNWGGVYPSWIVDPQKKKRKKNSSFLPTFLKNLSVPSSRVKLTKKFFLDCLNLEYGTNILSRNVVKSTFITFVNSQNNADLNKK